MTSSSKWIEDAPWGILCHWLADNFGASGTLTHGDSPAMSSADWNRHVDSFQVEALAAQLASVGARYFFLTIGQNSGFYCSPNATYDSIVDRPDSRLSERDLVADLSVALKTYGIQLGVYLPSGAPQHDHYACEKLNWKLQHHLQPEQQERLPEFQIMWEAVIREWSVRWGEDVFAWWVDGCYHADAMYRHPEAPNFESFRGALKAGNPGALVAFNAGVEPNLPIVSLLAGSGEDFTAGEIYSALPVPTLRQTGDYWNTGEVVRSETQEEAQRHILTFLGETWGQGKPRFSTAFVAEYTKLTNDCGGILTWDIPIRQDGTIDELFLHRLPAIAYLEPSS